ncbi:MAG TPA: cyclic nucleotide-binding domain-containing protein, partial [Polyangiaceae bacterium]|nr:cyclic nucleotide-binding domain-containing protein [Polyangiaceae bacterium]
MTVWTPLALGQRMDDLQLLSGTAALHAIEARDLPALTLLLEAATVEPGTVLGALTASSPGLYFVLEGSIELVARGSVHVLGPGASFGEASLFDDAADGSRVVAATTSRLARLSRARWHALSKSHPSIALVLAESAARRLSADLARRASEAEPSTSSASAGLPREVDGALVVAARVSNRTVRLDARVEAGVRVELVTTRDWEGREIYRRACGLVVLEAARRLGRHDFRLGPSWTSGRLVFTSSPPAEAVGLVTRINDEIAALIATGAAFREESMAIDDAIAHFERIGWPEVAALLATSTEPRVELVSCGDLLVPSPGVLPPAADVLSDVGVLPHPAGLALDFGGRVRSELAKRAVSTMVLETMSPRYGAEMTKEEQSWLDVLGITSVGSYNRAIVTGQVSELVHVSEGFQEKRLARLADDIVARKGVRIVAVAGPSSSGKTTFLRRLRVQLMVNGARPVGLGLDDYFLDRDKTPKDVSGALDFEALEASDLPLLRRHVERLLAGEKVKTARFDFLTGESHPEGGAELELGDSSVLLLEGIHAIDPAL